jgi:outer membrane receptor protein involved in Fe transport
VNISNLKFGNTEYNRVFVDINPRYKLNMDQLYINLGFNSTFFNDSTGTTFYFFPIAEAGINLIKNSLTTYVGITGNLQRNTYRSIANENPFVRSAGFRNTENSFELYGGLKGIISPQTSFLLNASLANVKNLLFYVGDSANLNSQKVVFDTKSSSVFNVKAELNHEFGNQFLLGFVMNYYSYSISIKAPYSMPTFTTQLNLGYNMSDKFLWKASVLTMNKRESGIEVAPNTINATTLKGFVDLNLGLDYRYTKNISLFVNLNNLTNNEYERWVNLPVYGFNVMGGLTVSF